MERTIASNFVKYLLPLLVGAFVWSLSTKTFAATLYFIGTGSVTNGTAAGTGTIWTRAANWSTVPKATHATSPAVPGASDTAVIMGSGGITLYIRSAVSVGGLLLSESFTGSLVQGSGTLSVGAGGIRIGSGYLIGGSRTLSSSGGITMTGGTIKNINGQLTISGSLSLRKVSSSRPSNFTATGTIVFTGNNASEAFFTNSSNVTTSFRNLIVNLSNIQTGADTTRKLYLSGAGLTLVNNLTVSGGTFDLTRTAVAQPLTVPGNIYVADNSTAKILGANNISLAGNLTVKPAGSLTLSGGTLTLTGTNKTLSGSMIFSGLTKNVTAGDILYFYPGYTYTVNGVQDLSGNSPSTRYLSLLSSVAGQQWKFHAPGRRTLNLVVLKDSNNTAGADKVCLDCTDSGNNSDWSFEAEATVATTTAASTGTGGGGGGGRRTSSASTATPTVVTPAVTPVTPAVSTKVSPIVKALKKRADALQAKITSTKNALKKKSMQRALDRLNKRINAKTK
ncbi:hypothetical protein A3J34_00665 [Candidatus Peribacteria bacterium RIFCSPLOWO2_02_FULL_51_10]|nr:MAG: hypothetical protein A3J34_00665 [Candidatus Peribacteria bacterium RIFCSPLOWO2_02_FULL_51_10]